MPLPSDLPDEELAAAMLKVAESAKNAPADTPCRQVRMRVMDMLLDEWLARKDAPSA